MDTRSSASWAIRARNKSTFPCMSGSSFSRKAMASRGVELWGGHDPGFTPALAICAWASPPPQLPTDHSRNYVIGSQKPTWLERKWCSRKSRPRPSPLDAFSRLTCIPSPTGLCVLRFGANPLEHRGPHVSREPAGSSSRSRPSTYLAAWLAGRLTMKDSSKECRLSKHCEDLLMARRHTYMGAQQIDNPWVKNIQSLLKRTSPNGVSRARFTSGEP